MRLYELDIEKYKGKVYNTPPPGHPDHNKKAKTQKQQPQHSPQPGAGTGPSMSFKMNVPQTSITMKDYRGGMARSMG
tara:strand:- start:338 stop:568 length:231 start_codon:yes stop_codon:yes gene_type:complete